MNLVSVPVLFMFAISFYVGWYHFFSYRVQKEKKENLYFALLCFSISLYDIFSIGLYNSKSVSEGMQWQRAQFFSIPLIAISCICVIYALIGRKKDWMFRILTVLFSLGIFLPFLPGGLVLSVHHANQRQIVLFQFRIDYFEAVPGPLINILYVMLIVGMVYLFALVIINYRKGYKKESFRLIIGCSLFFLSSILDILIGAGIIRFVYTAEYSFLGMILVMDYSLLKRFLSAHQEIASMNIRLEDQVNARTQKIQVLLEELRTINVELEDKVGELERAKYNLEESKDSIENIISSMTDALIVTDAQGRITKINHEALSLLAGGEEKSTGKSEDQILGRNVASFFPGETILEGYPLKVLQGRVPMRSHEIGCRGPEGKIIPLSLSASTARDSNDNVMGTVIILRDITTQKEMERNLRYLATHDSLTDLPNRLLLHDRVHQALSRAKRYKYYIAILLLDFDRFKEINDTLGHDFGDMLLKDAAVRIQKCLREYDTVARMGGDEYIVVLGDLKEEQDAGVVANRILGVFKTPFRINSREIRITSSIGISLYPSDGDSIESLLKTADMAMYAAKAPGGNRYCYFSSSMGKVVEERMTVKEGLQGAIERKEFFLHYQPLVDTNSGKVVAAEALLRWKHPQLGMVGPLTFIPVAETTGLIVPIGEWVLSTACRQSQAWQKEEFEHVPVAVNVSACQLRESDFVDKVTRILQESELPPEDLTLEITESAAMQNEEVAITVLEKLRRLGVKIFIDDFGSGYSSFNLLKKLPVNALKIDRFFVQHLVDDPTDAAIVTAIIAMAYSLHLKVIAEGVETRQQLDFLKTLKWSFEGNLQCDQVQGYLFSRPVPAEEFSRLLITQKRKGGLFPEE